MLASLFPRCEWSVERDLYYESVQMHNLGWSDAYWCCRKSIEYINKYRPRFEKHHESSRLAGFLASVLMPSFLAMAAILAFGTRMSLWQIILVAMGVSMVIGTLGFLARMVYYCRMESNLIHADNRVCELRAIWPDIVDIVKSMRLAKCDDLPPEPERATPKIGEIGICPEEIMDSIDISDIFPDKDKDGNGDDGHSIEDVLANFFVDDEQTTAEPGMDTAEMDWVTKPEITEPKESNDNETSRSSTPSSLELLIEDIDNLNKYLNLKKGP